MRDATSPSNLFRRKLCPGSEAAEADFIDTGSAAADEGTLLHPFAINPHLKRFHLTEAQQQLLMRADILTQQFLNRAGDTTGDDSPELSPSYEEVRIPIYGPDGEVLFSGQTDRTWALSQAAVSVDYKMGFTEVDEAPDNLQLASYAVGWTDYLDRSQAVVGIIQPRAQQWRRATMAVYSARDLQDARVNIASIVHAARQKDAPRIAGEKQCHFCKAKLFCEEYKRKFQPLLEKPNAYVVQALDNEELTRMAIAVKFAGRIERAVMDELTRRIQEGEIEGWTLKSNGETRELRDMVGAHRTLSEYFSGNEEYNGRAFTECTSLSWGKLTALFRRLTGFSERRAKATLNELLNEFTDRRSKSPTPVLTDESAAARDTFDLPTPSQGSLPDSPASPAE